MKWMGVNESKPLAGVGVHVVTKCGVRGISRYWDTIARWLSCDSRIPSNSEVTKWKYENAKIENKQEGR